MTASGEFQILRLAGGEKSAGDEKSAEDGAESISSEIRRYRSITRVKMKHMFILARMD